MTAGLTIRPVAAADAAAWRTLWTGYLGYYETVLPEEVFATTFARLTAAGQREIHGFLALDGDRPVGLVHFIFHPFSWQTEGLCYLQDLYTLPGMRGRGVARALIEAVYRAADAGGVPGVYWFTQDFNATARRLYDRIGVLTPFMRYNRRPGAVAAVPDGARVRPVMAGDAADWRRLWQGYLAFYETALPPEVTDATFAAVVADDPAGVRGLLLEVEGRAAGLVQHVAHRSCWKIARVTALLDLYVDPALRGGGHGAALIGAVYDAADRAGAPDVYWITQHFNTTARRLYDRIGVPTPLIEYDRPT